MANYIYILFSYRTYSNIMGNGLFPQLCWSTLKYITWLLFYLSIVLAQGKLKCTVGCYTHITNWSCVICVIYLAIFLPLVFFCNVLRICCIPGLILLSRYRKADTDTLVSLPFYLWLIIIYIYIIFTICLYLVKWRLSPFGAALMKGYMNSFLINSTLIVGAWPCLQWWYCYRW